MRQIAFSGMWCTPQTLIKDGQFKIKGTMSNPLMTNHPPIDRFEYFASSHERDTRYNNLMKQLEDSFWS